MTPRKAQATAFKRSHTQETVPLSISRSARVSTLSFLRNLFSKNHRALLLTDDPPIILSPPRSFLPSVVTGRHVNRPAADQEGDAPGDRCKEATVAGHGKEGECRTSLSRSRAVPSLRTFGGQRKQGKGSADKQPWQRSIGNSASRHCKYCGV